MKAVETKRTDLFAKTRAFHRAKDLQAAGLYPYFIPINEGHDPPLYQVYHDVGSDAATILAEGRRLVSPRLSEFLGAAVLENA